MTVRAVWNGVVIAEASRTRRVEGNHYFPPAGVRREYLSPSSTRTVCPWKGVAHHYRLVVDGAVCPDGAWYYPRPLLPARLLRIRDHVAFSAEVHIEESDSPD